ncbi:MAG: hypothetical protein O3B85_06480 [Planctomycetota bacterium]|nr:hypothetical protein [Planctomycetota bacterium]
MNRLLHGLALLPFLLAGCGILPSARISAGYNQTAVEGDFARGTGGPQDAETAFGVDGPAHGYQARAEAKAGPIHATARLATASTDGRGVLGDGFGSLPAGTTVSSDLDLTDADLAVSLDLFDLGPVRISPGIGFDIYDVDLDVAGAGARERLSETWELPYLFLQGEVDIGPLGAVVDLGWSDIELGGQDMSMLDAAAMLTFEPAAFVEFHAGYRLKSFEGTAGGGPDRRAVDLTTRGFFVGGGFSF